MPKDMDDPKVDWAALYASYKEHFEEQETVELIDQAAAATCAWLSENKQSYTAEGHLDRANGWWPKVSPTTDECLIEERGNTLRARIYGHGVRQFYWELVGSNVIADTPKLYDFVVEADTKVWWRELRKIDRVSSEDSLFLTEFKNLGSFGAGTSPSKSHPSLLKLCTVGFSIGTRNEAGHYQVRVGPTGSVFYDVVYLPVLKMFKDQLNPEAK